MEGKVECDECGEPAAVRYDDGSLKCLEHADQVTRFHAGK